MASALPAPVAGLEVPIFGPEHGILAIKAGARRLELNRVGSYDLGGLTPTLAELSALVTSLAELPIGHTIPIRIMIRLRGPHSNPQHVQEEQDFIYTPAELALMRAAIIEFKSSRLLDQGRGDGFVLGVVGELSKGEERRLRLDVDANRELVGLVRPFKAVCHRAFDGVLEVCGGEGVKEAVEELLACGFDGVLTSGGTGEEGVNEGGNAERIGDLKRALTEDGLGLEVVIGGGVRSRGLQGVRERLGEGVEGVWWHSSCLVRDGEVVRFDAGEAEGLVRALEGGI